MANQFVEALAILRFVSGLASVHPFLSNVYTSEIALTLHL